MGSGIPISSQPRVSLPGIDWSQQEYIKSLPTKTDATLDLAAVNGRLAKLRDTPVRVRQGTFRCPTDANWEQYFRIRNDAIKKFIQAMALQGWVLVGRVKVYPSKFPAMEVTDNPTDKKLMPGYAEFVVQAAFRKEDFRPVRIEVPGN